MVGRITAVVFSTRFVRDHKKLDAVQRAAVDSCIEDLYLDPIPDARRFHLLNRHLFGGSVLGQDDPQDHADDR